MRRGRRGEKEGSEKKEWRGKKEQRVCPFSFVLWSTYHPVLGAFIGRWGIPRAGA